MRTPLLLSLVFTVSIQAAIVPFSEKRVTAPTPDVAAFDQALARIATDGDAFLAVWIDHTLAGSGNVHGARVSSEGRRFDDEVLPIATTDADESRVGLAFGGDRYLVVWSTPTALRARFVARNGAMSSVFDVAALTAISRVGVAFNGNRFLVTWEAASTFRGATISTAGEVLKTFDIASSLATPDSAVVAANGAFHFITAIVDFNGVPNGNGFPSDVGVTRVDENGTVGTRVVVAPATTPVFDLNATSTATEILIGWTTAIGIPGATVRNVRVTSSGPGAIDVVPAEGLYLHDLVVDTVGFLFFYGADGTKFMRRPGAREPAGSVATPDTKTALLDSANNGVRTLVLLRGAHRIGFEYGPAGGDLYITRLDTMEIEPLVVAPGHQASPDVASAGDVRLAVWCEYIGSDRRLGVVASRLGTDVGIDLNADVYHPVAPRVASNGTDWLVVWIDGADVYGSRVAHNGSLLDAEPFVVAEDIYDGSDVAVSWDGTQYVVVYFRGIFNRGVRTTARATRISSQGAALAELTLSDEGPNELPAIAGHGNGSLVVWRNGTSAVRGGLLSNGGTFTPLSFPSLIATGLRPSVAWNDNTYLVAARQWVLVSATGVVRSPITEFVDVASAEPFGDGFLLFSFSDSNLFATRVDGEGVLRDGPVFVGAAASFGTAGNVVVYARKIGHAIGDITRVFWREVVQVSGNPRRRATHSTR